MRPSTIRQISRAMHPALSTVTRLSSRSLVPFTRPPCPHPHRYTRRWFSVPAPFINESDLSVERYHELSEATMDSLLDSLEALLDDIRNDEFDLEYHSGVLTLDLGNHGTYVINKQPPNKQIWLSSPRSGPKRYDYSDDQDEWVYTREGQSLGDLLNEELTSALGREVNLHLSSLSSKV